MRVSELFATEGYDTSSKNREWFYSGEYDDWKAAVREAGAAVVKGKDTDKAEGWDGLCGEWDHGTEKGWLVDKWSKKPVKEAVDPKLADILDAKANGADEVTYKGVCYVRSGSKNAVSKPGKWRATVKEGAEFGAYYYEQLAKKLPAGLKGEAIISAGFKQAVADIGKIKAHRYFYYDEDFPSDLASSYEWYQKNKDTVKEGIAKGSWKIQNLSGVMKTFKDAEQSDARAWMKNRGDASQIWDKTTGRWMEDPKKTDRELKKADRENAKWDRLDRAAEKARTNPKVDLQKIYNIVIGAIGDSFPDGDPIDHFAGPLRRLGVPEYSVMDYADKAMKKFGGKSEKKGVYGYLADMWDDMAGDAMYDAKNGGEARSPFVEIEDGKPVKQDNPWK